MYSWVIPGSQGTAIVSVFELQTGSRMFLYASSLVGFCPANAAQAKLSGVNIILSPGFPQLTAQRFNHRTE